MNRIIGIFAVVTLAGCTVGDPVKVPMTAASAALKARPISLAACGYWIESIRDSRPAAARAGDIGGRSVIAPNITASVAQTLEQASLERSTGEPSKALGVEVMSAYGYNKSTSMAFNTVLRAKIGDHTFIVRGNDTSLNWTTGETEIQTGLLRSVDRAGAQLVRRLAQHCGIPHSSAAALRQRRTQ